MPDDGGPSQRLLRLAPHAAIGACVRRPTLARTDQAVLDGSGGIYGYRKVHDDLCMLGESCRKNRVYRLINQNASRSQTGYRRRPQVRHSPASLVVPNHLKRQFDVMAPNQVWVTDITYVHTHEGWHFLAVVIDLFSRLVIGWSMGARMDRNLPLKLPTITNHPGHPQRQIGLDP